MSQVWKRRRTKVASALQRAAHWGPDWADSFLREAVASGIPGTPTPESVQAMIRTAVVLLEHRFSDAEKAREHRRDWVARLRPLRLERDAAAKCLYDTLIRIRGTATEVFGDGLAEQLFPPGSTPRQPAELLRLGGRLISRLEEDGEAHLRSHSLCRVDLPVFVEGIREKVQRLREALVGVTCGESAAARALAARNRALERLTRAEKGVERLFQALCGLTDSPETDRASSR